MSMFPIAVDTASQELRKNSHKAAKTRATILIMGETGVGKELLARDIHNHSACHTGPFVAINCAAIPANMVEAIFFGYERGAFTGAEQQFAGKFEQAQGGTLLLDEVSEIPLELQAKLLRVLQEQKMERLGGKQLIELNVRIIAATNVDLKQRVSQGLFRQDLFYRLSVFPIYCLPLRERREDIVPLMDHLILKYSSQLGITPPSITQQARQAFKAYTWHGNVREMENVIHRALILADKPTLDTSDFMLEEQTINSSSSTMLGSVLKENETLTILNILKDTQGNRELAAKKLKISPRTLRYKLSKLRLVGIDVP
jgi:two-component system response regulator FlrC